EARIAAVIKGQQRSLHPLEHIFARWQNVSVDLHSNVLALESELEQQLGIALRREERHDFHFQSELSRNLGRRNVGPMAVIGGHLHRELAVACQHLRQPREEPLMVLYPMERGVREDQIEWFSIEQFDVRVLEVQPGSGW